MKGETLQKVDHQPYLGVELSNNLKYNLHIDQTCKKASKILGFLKRNLKHCPSSVKDRAYTSLVRPKLEYNEYLYIFMFVLIVCNFQAWLWRVDVISAIVG
jgi:hypothetical protein